MALGNPFGTSARDSQPSLSLGVISALHRIAKKPGRRLYADAVQTDAALNPGNSGGALLDMQGRLIGINGMIRTPSRSNAGVGFAIPVNLIKLVLADMKKGKNIYWGLTGLDFKAVDSDRQKKLGAPAVEIGKIIKKGPAAAIAKKYGLKKGDVLLEIDGRKITNPTQVLNALYYHPAGSKVTFKFKHDKGGITTFELTTVDYIPTLKAESRKAIGLLLAKKYQQSYDLYKALIKEYPGEKLNLYNMACACSLMKKKKEAIDYLRRSMKATGFISLKHIKTDPDLENIRKEKGYLDLIKEYEKKVEEEKKKKAKEEDKKAKEEEKTFPGPEPKP